VSLIRSQQPLLPPLQFAQIGTLREREKEREEREH